MTLRVRAQRGGPACLPTGSRPCSDIAPLGLLKLAGGFTFHVVSVQSTAPWPPGASRQLVSPSL